MQRTLSVGMWHTSKDGPRLFRRVSALAGKSCKSSYSSITKAQYESIFGPRNIYDSAHLEERVLTIPYDQILQLPDLLPKYASSAKNNPSVTLDFTSDDLLIISKIMRRAPRLQEGADARLRSEVARSFCLEAAKMGNQAATLFWAEETLRTHNTSIEEKETAMQMLTNLAKDRVGKANYLLANELYSVKQEKAAMKAYRLAGEQGVAEAYTKLGRILSHRGHEKQSAAAFKLAADAGEPNAQFMMSTVTKNEAEKIRYLHMAASGGKEEAAHNLGDHYRRTGQVTLAREYLLMAAQRGFQISQMNLAALYQQEKKFKDAEAWYEQAGKSGGEVAQHAQEALEGMKDSAEYKQQSSGTCAIM